MVGQEWTRGFVCDPFTSFGRCCAALLWCQRCAKEAKVEKARQIRGRRPQINLGGAIFSMRTRSFCVSSRLGSCAWKRVDVWSPNVGNDMITFRIYEIDFIFSKIGDHSLPKLSCDGFQPIATIANSTTKVPKRTHRSFIPTISSGKCLLSSTRRMRRFSHFERACVWKLVSILCFSQ